MIHKKYRMFKNNGLLPKINQKTIEQNITTYALLNKCFRKEYQLHIDPSDHKKFVIFNASEYLQRQCSLVTVDSNPREVCFSHLDYQRNLEIVSLTRFYSYYVHCE